MGGSGAGERRWVVVAQGVKEGEKRVSRSDRG